jgi:hypothetical protein
MRSYDEARKRAQEFKAKHGVQDEQDQNIVATLHLMNTHDLDLPGAQDQTSRSGNDHGIDAWDYDGETALLTLYQSKLTQTKARALEGLDGLMEACTWLSEVLRTAEFDRLPTNTGIRNLAQCLANAHQSVRSVACVLISPFDPNELEDDDKFAFTRADLGKSALYELLKRRGGSLDLRIEQYKLAGGGVVPPTRYTVDVREGTFLSVRDRVNVRVVFVSLYSLTELFRRRGDLLFEKNVRFYLNTKEAKDRLEHPLEATLEQICCGSLDPNIFPFYHIGVALSTDDCGDGNDGNLSLDNPYIINGCQTVTIAKRYLDKLEKAKAPEKIERFKRIPVIAKIVVRASTPELREMTNANNRQNYVEPWQFFSNDQIHIDVETSLREVGVFYERQKGRFEVMTRLAARQTYHSTNDTYVKVEDLGQVICLCRRQLKLAAKPSEIFLKKEQHDAVFTKDIPKHPHDVIWSYNAYKAVKWALRKYLWQPTLDNEQTHRIFEKANVKQSMHYLAMMFIYQKRRAVSQDFIESLNNRAAPTLVEEAEACYRPTVKKTKEFYLAESKNFEVPDVSLQRIEGHLLTLCTHLGLDPKGAMPFTERAADWDVEQQQDNLTTAT